MAAPWTYVALFLVFLSTANSQEILSMETFQQGDDFTATCNLDTMRITDADDVLVISIHRQTESDTAPVLIGSYRPPDTINMGELAQNRNWDLQNIGTGVTTQLIAQITGTTCDDAGNYTCTCTYQKGIDYPTTGPIQDTISAAAKVKDIILSVDKFELTYLEGEVINFTCRVDGPDNLVIQWYTQCQQQNYVQWPFTNDIQTMPATDIPFAACGEKRHASILRYEVSGERCSVQCRAGLPNQAYSLQANMSITSSSAPTAAPPGGVVSGGSTDIGVIVGPIVGVLAVIVIVLLLVYFCWYRKRSKEDTYKDREDRPDATSDGHLNAPPPVFFTKPSKEPHDEKDHSRVVGMTNDAMDTSYDSKDSASRGPPRYANTDSDVEPSGPPRYDEENPVRGRYNDAYDNGYTGRRYDRERGDRRERGSRSQDDRRRRYSTEDGTDDHGYSYGDPSIGTAI